jgi:hypothetical protein
MEINEEKEPQNFKNNTVKFWRDDLFSFQLLFQQKNQKRKNKTICWRKGGRNVVDIGRGLFESPSVATVDSLATAESVTVTTQPQGFQNSAAPL